MLLFNSRDPNWLSNSWLIADRDGGDAFLIDSGAPTQEIQDFISLHDLNLKYVLCTHHHIDHVVHNDFYRDEYLCPICIHSAEADLVKGDVLELTDNQVFKSDNLEVKCLHVPGHTQGQLAFLVNEKYLFTGDTLFQGSVGGTRGPGHGTFEALQHSILNVLLSFPLSTRIYPGHMGPTTVEFEIDNNPFVRAWMDRDKVVPEKSLYKGEAVHLLLRARDYDGGSKCWIESFDGRQDIVPGSHVTAL